MNQKILTAIKVISTLLIASAIGLELWNITAEFTNSQLPNLPGVLFLISRFALTAHAIEGTIAAIYAPTKKKMFLPYSIYIFFVGTVGLLELFDLLPITSTES
jgi:hypothetical protein